MYAPETTYIPLIYQMHLEAVDDCSAVPSDYTEIPFGANPITPLNLDSILPLVKYPLFFLYSINIKNKFQCYSSVYVNGIKKLLSLSCCFADNGTGFQIHKQKNQVIYYESFIYFSSASSAFIRYGRHLIC